MIQVDIAELENLTLNIFRAADHTEESLHHLRMLIFEMQDDLELAAYPQSVDAVESARQAMVQLTRTSDALTGLRNAMHTVADIYRQQEQANRSALSRMLTVMDTVSTGYNAAVTSPNLRPVEHEDPVTAQADVQQLVASAAEEMQVANISAVAKIIEKEYWISQVLPMTADRE